MYVRGPMQHKAAPRSNPDLKVGLRLRRARTGKGGRESKPVCGALQGRTAMRRAGTGLRDQPAQAAVQCVQSIVLFVELFLLPGNPHPQTQALAKSSDDHAEHHDADQQLQQSEARLFHRASLAPKPRRWVDSATSR